MIAKLVKGLEVLRGFDLVFRQPAYHLASGHLAFGTLFDDLAVFQLPEGTGDKSDGFGQTSPTALLYSLEARFSTTSVFEANCLARRLPQN